MALSWDDPGTWAPDEIAAQVRADRYAEQEYERKQEIKRIAKRIALAAIEDAKSRTLRVVCAWCGAVIIDGPETPVSHGICSTCYETEIAPQLQEPIDGREPARVLTDAVVKY